MGHNHDFLNHVYGLMNEETVNYMKLYWYWHAF